MPLFISLLITITFTEALQAKGDPPPLKGHTLIVVHPTNYYAKGEDRENINDMAKRFLAQNNPVITLVESKDIAQQLKSGNVRTEEAKQYQEYFDYFQEGQLVISKEGKNHIQTQTSQITFAGGYLTACLRLALKDLILQNIEKHQRMEFYLPLKAIYGEHILQKEGKSLKEAIIKRVSSHRDNHQQIRVSIYLNEEKIYQSSSKNKKTVNLYIKRDPRDSQPQDLKFLAPAKLSL